MTGRTFQIQHSIRDKACLVERTFGLRLNALAEAIEHARTLLDTPVIATA